MSDYKLHKLTEHVYYMQSDASTDRPVLGAVIGNEKNLIVDAGNSPAHADIFLKELNKLKTHQNKLVAITHWHWDHVFGIHTMNLPTIAHEKTTREVENMTTLDWSDEALDERVRQGIEIEFCSENIKKELPNRKNLRLKAPDISFDKRLRIDLGGVKCIIEHVGGDHSDDCTVIYVEEDGVVFLGDCLYFDMYHGEMSWSTKKIFPLMSKLLSYDAKYYIEAHNAIPVKREQLEQDFKKYRLIGELVELYRYNREKIIEEFYNKSGCVLKEEDYEFLEAYIAGITK